MQIGLYFGSFNPIHVGHLIIANTILSCSDCDEIWFVVSPRNPLKSAKSLLHEFDRYDMVQRAIADNYNFRVTDVEFHMPKPSYTVDTLAYLSDKHQQKQFSLIIGEDNLASFKKWKNHEAILENHGLLVYPRPNEKSDLEIKAHPNVRVIEAPLLDISATFIRQMIRQGNSIRYLVPDEVAELINAKKFYS